MIGRLIERAGRRTARRLLLASRSVALRLSHWPDPTEHGRGAEEIRRVVAVRLDRLGDLVLTLPALDDLATAYPKARLIALVRPALATLLRGRPSVHQVVPLPHHVDVETLASRIAALEADLAVDFSAEGELLAARALARAGVPSRIGLAGGGREVFFTRTARAPRALSLLETNELLVEAADGKTAHRRPAYSVPPEEDWQAEGLLRRKGAGPSGMRIAVHPGGYYASQRWPVERFAETARQLATRRRGKVVILGGPEDGKLVDSLNRLLAEQAVAVPPTGLRTLAAVLARCDLLLANNSGPLHLAGAVGLPTVSVMGPTDPLRFWPCGEHQVVLRREELPCSPCSRGYCAPHDCLKGISVEEVVRAAEGLLDRVASRPARAGTEVGA